MQEGDRIKIHTYVPSQGCTCGIPVGEIGTIIAPDCPLGNGLYNVAIDGRSPKGYLISSRYFHLID